MIEHINLSIIAFFLRSLAVDAAFLGFSALARPDSGRLVGMKVTTASRWRLLLTD